MDAFKTPPTFVFDLDDTIFNTAFELRLRLYNQYGINPASSNVYLQGKELDEIIADGRFMETAPPFAGLEKLSDVCQQVRRLGSKIIIATHRPPSPQSVEYTKQAVDKHIGEVDAILHLECSDHPCKETYLLNYIGHRHFYLFDDTPIRINKNISGDIDVYATLQNTVLVNAGHNQHFTSPLLGRVDPHQIPERMDKIANKWVIRRSYG